MRVLDNLSTGHLSNLEAFRDQVEFVEGDLRDAKVMAQVVDGVDCIFHEAALASVPRSVTVTPGSAFGERGEHHVRMAYCVCEDVINTAFDRIERHFDSA